MSIRPSALGAALTSAPALLIAGLLTLSAAQAAEPAAERIAEISVTGTGSTDVAPDMAIISVSVVRDSESARTALTDNTNAMSAVVAAMKAAGIAERDLQTAGFSIQPRVVYPQRGESTQPPRTVGYTVSNSLSIRVRDLSQVGSILDKAVTLGVNQGGQLTFTNAEPARHISQARERAMADAIDKATTLTRAAGARLGRVLTISEQLSRPQPMMMMRSAMSADAASASVPIEAGETSYSVTVNVSWAIEP